MISRIDIEDMTDAQDEALNEANTMRDRLNTKRIWDMHRPFLLERTSDDPLYHASMWIMLLCDEIDKLRADLARPSQAGDERVARLVKEYRPTMDAEVLHSWAQDVVAALAAMDTPKGGGDE